MEQHNEYRCKCGRVFDNSQALNGHRSHCLAHLGEEKYKTSVDRQSITQSKAAEANRQKGIQSHKDKENKLLEWVSEKHTCEKCGKIMIEKFATGRFCSIECANSKSHSDDTRLKIAKSLKTFYEDNTAQNDQTYLDFSNYIPGTKELYLNNVVNCKNIQYYLLDQREGVDFIICPYCNVRLASINAGHLRQHNKTVKDLKNEFGESYATISEMSSLKRSKNSAKAQQKLISEGKHIGWTTRNIRSYAELFWERVLTNNQIKYEPEYVVKKSDIGINESGCYFLDFLIDGYIDLEIDGKQHQYEDRKEHDILRDERLQANGFVIYRIPWINPEESAKVKRQIDEFLAWYTKLSEYGFTLKNKDVIN